LKSLDGHDGNILCLCYSPDGRSIAVGTATAHIDGVILWDVETGKRSKSIKVSDNDCKVVDVRFTADGTRLVFAVQGGGQDAVRIWDFKQGRLSHLPFHPSTEETCVACQPQGRIWARSIGNGRNFVHDTHYGIEEHQFHFGPRPHYVGDIAFTPDGRHLVSGFAGGAICILRLQQWKAEMKKPSEELFD
jgi:WD40 repeat protein